VVVLGLEEPETKKAALLIAVGPQGPKGVQANELLKQLAPFIDGKGGGKPDLAQAGGTKPQGLNDAIAQARRSLSEGV
jgi:alanyl-tRNA synthetase